MEDESMAKTEGLCPHGNFFGSCEICSAEGNLVSSEIADKERVNLDIQKKLGDLQQWRESLGIPKEDVVTMRINESEKPWETNELIILVDSSHYTKAKQWIESSPNTKIDFSWSGRFAAYDQTPEGWYKPGSTFRDFAFFDKDQSGQRTVKTHHESFKAFAQSQGVELPNANVVQEKLNSINQEKYRQVLAAIEDKMNSASPDELYRLKELHGKLSATLIFARLGVAEPKESYNIDNKELPTHQETSYNDIIYNADDFLTTSEYKELGIPVQDRLDFIDGKTIEALCKKFGDELVRQGVYK